MKKFLCMLVCLMMMIPAALAETANDTVVYDFGDFTMDVMASDEVQLGEKANGSVMAMLLPAALQGGALSPNLNVIWYEESILPLVNQLGPEAYGQAVVEAIVPQMEAAGLVVSDMQLLGSQLIENSEENNCTVLAILYTMNADYTNLGADIQTPMYQEMVYYIPEGAGMYCITATAYDAEGAELLDGYLNTVKFK